MAHPKFNKYNLDHFVSNFANVNIYLKTSEITMQFYATNSKTYLKNIIYIANMILNSYFCVMRRFINKKENHKTA